MLTKKKIEIAYNSIHLYIISKLITLIKLNKKYKNPLVNNEKFH